MPHACRQIRNKTGFNNRALRKNKFNLLVDLGATLVSLSAGDRNIEILPIFFMEAGTHFSQRKLETKNRIVS